MLHLGEAFFYIVLITLCGIAFALLVGERTPTIRDAPDDDIDFDW